MVRLNRYRSPKARARRNRALVFRSVLVACFTLFLVGSAGTLFLIPALMVREIRVSGTEDSLLESRIRTIALRESSHYLFYVFPRRNTFLYPLDAIARAVQDELPEIAHVEAQHDDIHTIHITIEIRKPFALWCGDIVPLPGDPPGDCYIIDTNGVVYAHKDEADIPTERAASTTMSIYFYGALGEGGLPGAQFLTPERFGRLRDFVELLSGRGMPVVSSITIDDTQGEITLQSGVRVLYTEQSTAEDIVRRLTLLLHASDIDPTALEYIDLRFGNKVFVKPQETKTPPVDSHL